MGAAENHGGFGQWGGYGQGQSSGYVSGDGGTSEDPASDPEIFQSLSLAQGRLFADPKDLTDNYKFDGKKNLAGCAIILEGCTFTLDEVDVVLAEAMDMRFTLNAVVGVDDAFPFGVALPVGSYLNLLINPEAQSGLALIETVFRSLVRHHPGRQKGLVKDFKANVATRAKRQAAAEVEVVATDAGGKGVAGATRQSDQKAKEATEGVTLEIVVGALLDSIAFELNRLWTTEVLANGAVFTLPAPLLTTLLEEKCDLDTISDMLITLQAPEIPDTAWQYAQASTAAESALRDLGFSCADLATVQGCSLTTKVRFVEKWKKDGVAKSRQKKRSPPPAKKSLSHQLGKQQKRQGESASLWQQGGGPGLSGSLLQGGAPVTPLPFGTGHQPPVANLGGGGLFGKPMAKGPRSDEERRLETEAVGAKANAGIPDRSAALAMHAPLSAQEGGQALDAFFHRQAQQHLLALGDGSGGSGGINLGTAPACMRRSVIRGEGDKVQKLDPQAGLAVAPGVAADIKFAVQTGMGEVGVEMSYGMIAHVIQFAYHEVRIQHMRCVGLSNCRVGGEFTVKVNPTADTALAASGPAIFEFLEHLILARQLFDPDSVHTQDLAALLTSIKRAKNQGIRVKATWTAMQRQFQSFHHAIQNWAGSSAGGPEPRLSDNYTAANSLWQKAFTTGAHFDSTDAAWSVAANVPAASGAASGTAAKTTPPGAVTFSLAKANAQGDGASKTRGNKGWPNHLSMAKVCGSYRAGRTCRFGKQCNSYCYMTLDAKKYES
jgi:hypothetical protein